MTSYTDISVGIAAVLLAIALVCAAAYLYGYAEGIREARRDDTERERADYLRRHGLP